MKNFSMCKRFVERNREKKNDNRCFSVRLHIYKLVCVCVFWRALHLDFKFSHSFVKTKNPKISGECGGESVSVCFLIKHAFSFSSCSHSFCDRSFFHVRFPIFLLPGFFFVVVVVSRCVVLFGVFLLVLFYSFHHHLSSLSFSPAEPSVIY